MASLTRRLLLVGALMCGVLALGTVGFRLVEGWDWFDCFYMALISVTTVGYQEVEPLTHLGRVFTSLFLILGVTVVFVSLGVMADLLLQLELRDYFGRRRLSRMLNQLSDHYIVCGAGRVGRGVIRELERSGVKLVLIDNDPRRVRWAESRGIPVLAADATLDESLSQAGVERAEGLVAAIGSDAENVYVTLSARVLNPTLRIAARATNEQAEEKLKRAGAMTVFSPYSFIGHRLAQALLRPHVLSFLDVASAMRGSDLEIEIEQIMVSPNSAVAATTLEQCRLRQTYGVIVLALIRASGEMLFNPDGESRIEADDVLIAMGERKRLKQLEEKLEG